MPNPATKNPRLPDRQKRPTWGDLLRRLSASLTRWRGSFTRENFIDAAKTFAWIAPLTILIWVYAEREQTVANFPVSDVPVEISSNDMFVEPVNPGTPKVTLVLTGPQSGLDKVKDSLANAPQRGLKIDIGNSFNPGNSQQINVVNRIQNLPIFKDNGVSVTESRPADILIDVDKFAERELEVQSPPDVTNLNKADTHYEPRKVIARGPASVLSSLADRGLLSADADLSGNEILKSPGTHELTVPVRLPALAGKEDRVTFDPSSVKAFLDVRAADVTGFIPSLPIWIECPPGLLDTYKVVFTNGESTIASINVTGPQSQIDLLPTAQKWAGLVVTGNDLSHAVSRTLDYHLPPGVVVSPDDKKREVTFQLKKREGTE